MAFSQATLVKRVRTYIDDDPWLDICLEAMDTTEVGLDVGDGTEWSEGDIVEFQDDGEQCRVTSISSNTLTVVRNHNFSVGATAGTGTSHSANAVIAKNPVVKYVQITQVVQDVLLDLWPYVYRKYSPAALQKTPDADGDPWYDLDTVVQDINSVYQIPQTGRMFFYGVRGDTYPVEFHQDISTTVVASGVGLYIPHLKHPTNTIIVNGIARIDATLSVGDYSHLNDGVEVNTVVYLTVAELIALTDIRRTTQDDVSMGDASVRPLARTQLAEYWRAKGIRSRKQWQLHLSRTYPRMQRREAKRPRSRY